LVKWLFNNESPLMDGDVEQLKQKPKGVQEL